MNRKEQIRNKAKELGQQYFPDEANIWARGNIEAEYVECACVEMAKWLDQHPNWISVEDELPKEDEEVLAYNSLYNEKYLCVYHNGKFEDYLGELGKGAVSHWMPIVPPRKEE